MSPIPPHKNLKTRENSQEGSEFSFKHYTDLGKPLWQYYREENVPPMNHNR